GPAPSARSSAASCCSSSRHCAARPREASPARPAACQACRHRRTDRSLTRSSAAITAAGAPCSNLLPASSRTSSRRLRPSAVSPPPCAYRMHPAYRRKPPTSAPRTSPIKGLYYALAYLGFATPYLAAGLGALAGKTGAFVALTVIIAALALWTAGYAARLRRSASRPEGDTLVRWSRRNCDSVSR